jgi:hypothetical protein
MSTPPSLADILTSVLNAVQTIMYQIATAIADNATVIANVLVLGGLAVGVYAVGRRLVRLISGWFRGLF